MLVGWVEQLDSQLGEGDMSWAVPKVVRVVSSDSSVPPRLRRQGTSSTGSSGAGTGRRPARAITFGYWATSSASRHTLGSAHSVLRATLRPPQRRGRRRHDRVHDPAADTADDPGPRRLPRIQHSLDAPRGDGKEDVTRCHLTRDLRCGCQDARGGWVGGQDSRSGSWGLMIPTLLPSGSSTIAYRPPQKASYGGWWPLWPAPVRSV